MVPDATARELSMHYGELSMNYTVCNCDLVILIKGEKPPATHKGLLVFGI